MSTGSKNLTLRELHDALVPLIEQYGHLPVLSEGCDCEGEVGAIEVNEDRCLLTRVVVDRATKQAVRNVAWLRSIGIESSIGEDTVETRSLIDTVLGKHSGT